MHANHATTKKMYSIMNGLIPFNRVFGYYMNEYVMSYHAGKDIRLYNQKDLIMGESEKLFGDVDRVINELAANQRKYSDLVAVSAAIISALIYLFVGLKALAGVFGVGMVIRYIGSIQEFTAGFTGFMTQLAALRSNNEALSLYFEFLDIPSEME